VRVFKSKLGAQAVVGRQYALFIAIDKYKDWNALRQPLKDAKELRDILTENYYIDEVVELYGGDVWRRRYIFIGKRPTAHTKAQSAKEVDDGRDSTDGADV
jgi:hypothetical protein